jgi:hypothetical protein
MKPKMTKNKAIELLRQELKDILIWHRTEKIPLREQELRSIRATLADTEGFNP